MHAPQRLTHSPLRLVIIATLPLILAAVSVWMVRDALATSAPVAVESATAPTNTLVKSH